MFPVECYSYVISNYEFTGDINIPNLAFFFNWENYLYFEITALKMFFF